jgi:alpha-amylase/alpha-mannosidase (GH57 family)
MQLWHLTSDTPRLPHRVSPNERVKLIIGTWPIAPEQFVWVTYRVESQDSIGTEKHSDAVWQGNNGVNSYWEVELGAFARGEHVAYTVHSCSTEGEMKGATESFQVVPKLYLALLWHQHQPMYKNTAHPVQTGSYIHPWVRLHAIRDYYSMAALVAEHPDVHLTINLTPVLLWQIEDYVERSATDRMLELTLTPAETLNHKEQEEILSSFFDADWHNQIFPHPRYKELFNQQREGQPFTTQDLRDLQMWFNLAWFGKEFREGDVKLVTGETVSVCRFIEQERDFSVSDIKAMVSEQCKLMRSVIPIHRQLQDNGQIEVSTTPLYHPILPLLIDTDRATLDRPGTTYPHRFAYPEDAERQVRLAVDDYCQYFGLAPRGMWPAEGAVSQSVIPLFAQYGVRWLATDRGVLARSGQWGYNVDDANVLCQPYRVEEGEYAVTVFFRDTSLSDAIGFHYYAYTDYEQAARDFLGEMKRRFVWPLTDDTDRVLTIVLDGENAWGAYRDDARPFLHALYSLLERDDDIQTVTFADYLEGRPTRDVAPHPLEAQNKVHNLFTGSWIDENGSAPGVDLGTWIGEDEENRGWELLGHARDFLAKSGATPATAPSAFEALYIAEGSDWFWWFGADQDSGNDEEFDDLFRLHLKNIYRGLEVQPPAELDRNIVQHSILWTFTHPVPQIQPGDRLTIRTNCPGVLTWQCNGEQFYTAELLPAGGVMAGVHRYHVTLGPFEPWAQDVRFHFQCTHPGCSGQDICCDPTEYIVHIQ